MPQQFINNWAALLTSGITDVATTIPIAAVDAAKISDASATNYYYLTLDDSANIEIVKVTAANGSTGDLTVVRAQEGTTGYAFLAGDLIEARATAQSFDDLQNMPDTHADNALLKGNAANSKKLQATGLVVDDDNNLSGHGATIRTVAGTTDTILAADNGIVVEYTSATAVAVTLPQQSTTTLPKGFQCLIAQRGAGQVTIAKEGTDVIESKDGNVKLTGQYSAATVILVNTTTQNNWLVIGDLSA